jgi:hypothetical protein
MSNITQISRQLIETIPFIEEGLYKKIVHYGGLAKYLQPEIEKQLKKKVKISAIIMGLRRIGEEIQEKHLSEIKKLEIKSEILVRSDLFEITIINSKKTINKIKNIHSLINFKKKDFLAITQGIYETTIITNKIYIDKIKKMFSKEEIEIIIQELSALILRISPESWKIVGLFYIVIKKLSWYNIGIIEIVSTLTEMTFIIRKEDTGRAFDVFSKEF